MRESDDIQAPLREPVAAQTRCSDLPSLEPHLFGFNFRDSDAI